MTLGKGTLDLDVVAIGLCLGLAAAGWWFGFRPLQEVGEIRSIQAVELKARRNEAASAAETLARLQKELAEAQAAVQATPITLLSAEHSNRRLDELAQLASEHGLKLQAVRTDAPLTRKHSQLIPIHLNGDGSFPDCTRFLHLLHQRFPDMGVRTFELAHNTSGVGAASTFRFELAWYAAPSLADAQK